jgi:hypothetical protein
MSSVADPHPLDADPDPTYHFDADLNADSEPDFLFDVHPDADPDFYLIRMRIRI